MDTNKAIKSKVQDLTPADWQQLENLRAKTNEYKGNFAEYSGETTEDDGTIVLGYTKSPEVVHDVMKFFYDKKLVINFDWGSWDEGREIFKRTGTDKFDDVSLEDTLRLFTAVLRNDRFNEGAFARFFESGDAILLLDHLISFESQ